MKISNSLPVGLTSANPKQTKNATGKETVEAPGTNNTGPESIWRKIASKYDVRSITPEETVDLSEDLLDAGKISGQDQLLLSLRFNPNDLPSLRGLTFYRTKPDGEGRRDLIAEYTARIELGQYSTPTAETTEHFKRILEVSNHLDAAKNSPINIVA